MRRILKTVLVILSMIMATPSIHTIAKEPIKVVIDQQPLTLDQPPILQEGRVFLPLRGILEALGAEVDWDPKTQSVIGTRDNVVIKLEIGKRQASVNDEKILMDIPGKMINNRAMVPVRFVAENLGVVVDWDDSHQVVIISTTKTATITPEKEDIKAQAPNSDVTVYKTTNLKDDYVEIQVDGNGLFEIKGQTLSNNQYVLVEIIDPKGNELFNNQSQITSDGRFSQIYDLNLSDGQHIVNIFMNNQEYGNYQGTNLGIAMIKSKDGLVFKKSSIYKDNVQQLSRSNKVSSSDLSLHSFSEGNKNRLSKLATSITEDEGTDYYKALAIANWVSDNIYYDVGAAESGKLGKTDAIGTLDEKRSVCQGYAALTTGLLRSIGIPTKLVFGYALGVEPGSDSWEKVDYTRPNHVWNEVFVDNRWIIVDTTWNSTNTYEKGNYIDGDKKYTYFDPTVEAFSETHKITNR